SDTVWTRLSGDGTASAPLGDAARGCAAAPCSTAARTVGGVACCSWDAGRAKTTAAATAATTGTATTSARRQVKRRGGAGAAAATRRTRWRSRSGASTCAERSSATRSRCDIECLLELLERAVQARRAVGRRDAEDACGRAGVEVEQDAQRDHLALACRETPERRLDVGRQPVGKAELDGFRRCGELLPAESAPLRPEMVERDRPRHLEEPGARGAATRVEAVPQAKRAFERGPRQLLGREAVGREPHEVAVDVVEVCLCRLLERHSLVVRHEAAV